MVESLSFFSRHLFTIRLNLLEGLPSSRAILDYENPIRSDWIVGCLRTRSSEIGQFECIGSIMQS